MKLHKIIKHLESVQNPYNSIVIIKAIELLNKQKSEIDKLRFTIKTIIDLQLNFSKKEKIKIEITKPEIKIFPERGENNGN